MAERLPAPERHKSGPSPFCDLLRYHMSRYGISVRDMADKTKIGAGTIGHILTGHVRPPIGDNLDAIIRALHLDLDQAKTLKLEALLGNAPSELRAYVKELERKALGK